MAMNLKWFSMSTYHVLYDTTERADAPNKVLIWDNGACEVWVEKDATWRIVDCTGMSLEDKKALLAAEYRLQ